MRDIHTVIAQIENKVPPDRTRFLLDLTRIYSGTLFHAPETQHADWEHLQAVLEVYIGRHPSERWEFEALSIFSEVSITELMQDVERRK